MELEKRKKICDGEEADRKRGKTAEEDGGDAVEAVVPADEEVEEFFAILRRIQVAIKYFQKHSGGGESAAAAAPAPWSPSFEREDFYGVEKTPEKREGNQNAGLDLNSDPASDETVLSDPV